MKTGWANRETSSKLNNCYAVSQKKYFFLLAACGSKLFPSKQDKLIPFTAVIVLLRYFYSCVYIPLFTYMYIRNHHKNLTENYPARKCNLSKMKNGNENISSVVIKHFNVNKMKKKKSKFSFSEFNWMLQLKCFKLILLCVRFVLFPLWD